MTQPADTRPPTLPSDPGSVRTPARPARIAILGNPNVGKSSLFNALTGFRRSVANFPGVTVELGRGPLKASTRPIELLDLPGTYSLTAISPDELIVTDFLAGRLPAEQSADALVVVVDATNLTRNCYLLSQLLELNLPLVVALNMTDLAAARGIRIDAVQFAKRLGCPVIPVAATDPGTLPPLVAALGELLDADPPTTRVDLPESLEAAAAELANATPQPLPRAEALRILFDQEGQVEAHYLAQGGNARVLSTARAAVREAGIDSPAVEVRARYAWVNRLLDGLLERRASARRTWSDRLDTVLTHKLGGAVVLLAVLFIVFQSIFTWALPLMDLIDAAFVALANIIGPLLPAGFLRSLVTDGIFGGIGGVLVFLPQIMILFAFIAILEDCGYLARAAYMVDRLMRTIGLSGRAFIPLVSSFACAVPAIMGARAIADRRERVITILIAPFMSCSARLPVYVLLTAAFIPPITYANGWISLQALVMLGMYLVGVLIAIPLAWLLKKTVFGGPASGFMLELPSYKLPRLRAIWQRSFEAGKSFIINAGTVILVVNLIVWFLGYFPRSDETRTAVEQRAASQNWDDHRFEEELAGAYVRDSWLGRFGRFIEPAIEPLGWDWRIGVAVIASFPAREVVVATLGTIFNLGDDEDENSVGLRQELKAARHADTNRPLFTIPVALSLMIFFALCAQCSSTLVVMGRETGSWLWPIASFVTMTTIAYLAALAVATVARLFA